MKINAKFIKPDNGEFKFKIPSSKNSMENISVNEKS